MIREFGTFARIRPPDQIERAIHQHLQLRRPIPVRLAIMKAMRTARLSSQFYRGRPMWPLNFSDARFDRTNVGKLAGLAQPEQRADAPS